MPTPPSRKDFVADGYPALKEFFSGYLHEDFKAEHGSAVSAARAYCQAAGSDELSQIRAEWKRWETAFTGKALNEKQAALRKLGAGWEPQREEELNSVIDVLKRSR